MIRPHAHGFVQKRLEFNLGVTEHIGVGGAARGIFPQKVGKAALLVLLGEIDRLEVNADHVSSACGIDKILAA